MPTRWTSSATAGRDDLLRRQPDALVDDLEAGVARPHRDLLGAVGVPVETGLADEDPQRSPSSSPVRATSDAHVGERLRAGAGPRPSRRPRWGPELAEHLAQRAAHSPVVTPARAHSSVAGMRLVVGGGVLDEAREADAARSAAGVGVAAPRASAAPPRPRLPRPGVDRLDRGPRGRP